MASEPRLATAPPSSGAIRSTATSPRVAPAATAEDAVAAVEAAAAAFKTWSRTGPGERRALLMKAAQALEAQGAAFADAVASETGASAIWAGFNVHLAAGMLLEAASLTTQISGEVIPSDVPGTSPWACASRPAWCWASHPGTRR